MLKTVESRVDEAALVNSARNGDRTAFGALYEQYARLVHGILLSHVEYHEAEDLVQDTFVKALRQLPNLRDPAAFGSWLATIARRIAADHHRQCKPTVRASDVFRGSPQPSRESFEILDFIQKLPESYRETLILRLVEGLTGPEIAMQTGLTPDSVRVNLCRGMKLLRSQLEGRAHHE